jgi:hypothetical protein
LRPALSLVSNDKRIDMQVIDIFFTEQKVHVVGRTYAYMIQNFFLISTKGLPQSSSAHYGLHNQGRTGMTFPATTLSLNLIEGLTRAIHTKLHEDHTFNNVVENVFFMGSQQGTKNAYNSHMELQGNSYYWHQNRSPYENFHRLNKPSIEWQYIDMGIEVMANTGEPRDSGLSLFLDIPYAFAVFKSFGFDVTGDDFMNSSYLGGITARRRRSCYLKGKTKQVKKIKIKL